MSEPSGQDITTCLLSHPIQYGGQLVSDVHMALHVKPPISQMYVS